MTRIGLYLRTAMVTAAWLEDSADSTMSRQFCGTRFIGYRYNNELSIQDCSFCLWLCSGYLPSYFRGVCTPLTEVSGRVGLRSAHRGDLYVPTTRSELGKRSFRVAARRIWNSLPLHLRSFTISREQFRARFKTHLFKCAYTWLTSKNYWGV